MTTFILTPDEGLHRWFNDDDAYTALCQACRHYHGEDVRSHALGRRVFGGVEVMWHHRLGVVALECETEADAFQVILTWLQATGQEPPTTGEEGPGEIERR